MHIYSLLIVTCWLVFIAVWAVSSFTAKQNLYKTAMLRWFVFRAAVAFVIAVAVSSQIAGKFSTHDLTGPANPTAGIIGVVICAAGIAFAIWARFYLGRNWGMPMSVKKDPELVTGGPYAYVRHPIYTGILSAILGSGLASGGSWPLVLIVSGACFIYSATREEELMQKTFPDAYPAYKKSTKMLIPFVF